MTEPDPERLIPLAEAARLLGVPHKTLLNKLARGEAPELRARKLWGRWKTPFAAVRELAERGTARRSLVAEMFDRVDYPHLRRRGGRVDKGGGR